MNFFTLGFALFLLIINFKSEAQEIPDYVKENSFYKQFSKSSGEELKLVFSDGYEQPMVGPFEMKESAHQARCCVKSYDVTYREKNGNAVTRTMVFWKDKKDSIDYFGKDNKKYQINQLLDSSGKSLAGGDQSSNGCEYIGTPNILKIKNKGSCGDSKICYGKVRNCGNKPELDISCLADGDSQCPDAKDCFDDPNVNFSSSDSISKRKSSSESSKSSSAIKQ